MVQVNKQIAHDTFTRHTVVFSNVPGPDYAVTFAGQDVEAYVHPTSPVARSRPAPT